MEHLVDELDLPDFEFYAWDARGHGRSPGERGYSPSFAASVRDVQSFVDHLGEAYSVEPEKTAVIAQSVGAVLISTWAHDYAPKVRALVLALSLPSWTFWLMPVLAVLLAATAVNRVYRGLQEL